MTRQPLDQNPHAQAGHQTRGDRAYGAAVAARYSVKPGGRDYDSCLSDAVRFAKISGREYGVIYLYTHKGSGIGYGFAVNVLDEAKDFGKEVVPIAHPDGRIQEWISA